MGVVIRQRTGDDSSVSENINETADFTMLTPFTSDPFAATLLALSLHAGYAKRRAAADCP